MRRIRTLKLDDFTENRLASHPPSTQLIESFETYFGVCLPSCYLSFLQQSNGGAPSVSVFQMTSDSGEIGTSNVSSFFHLVEDREDDYGVWNNTKFLRGMLEHSGIPLEPQNAMAIGENGSGAIILLDLSPDKEEVKIVYRQSAGSILHIANTFEEFIDGLRDIDSGE